MELDFNHPTKSLLQQEQELLDSGEIENEDDLTRLYPNIIGNGHPDVCLCPACAPGEYEYHKEDDDTLVIYDDGPFDNFGYTDEELLAIQQSNPTTVTIPKDAPGLRSLVLEEDLIDDMFPF